MMIYCANCETEAIKAVLHQDGGRTPLCYTCSVAYGWGQASPEAIIRHIEHIDMVELPDGSYAEYQR